MAWRGLAWQVPKVSTTTLARAYGVLLGEAGGAVMATRARPAVWAGERRATVVVREEAGAALAPLGPRPSTCCADRVSPFG